jgi:hypothetical protein
MIGVADRDDVSTGVSTAGSIQPHATSRTIATLRHTAPRRPGNTRAEIPWLRSSTLFIVEYGSVAGSVTGSDTESNGESKTGSTPSSFIMIRS